MKNSVNALPAIVLSDISKQFGTGESQVSALKGVNLEIAKGEFIALCGHIIQHVQHRDQIEELEDKAEMLTTNRGHLLFGKSVEQMI